MLKVEIINHFSTHSENFNKISQFTKLKNDEEALR